MFPLQPGCDCVVSKPIRENMKVLFHEMYTSCLTKLWLSMLCVPWDVPGLHLDFLFVIYELTNEVVSVIQEWPHWRLGSTDKKSEDTSGHLTTRKDKSTWLPMLVYRVVLESFKLHHLFLFDISSLCSLPLILHHKHPKLDTQATMISHSLVHWRRHCYNFIDNRWKS